ncbi:DEAD/DEAH box helicase [Asticcacaulis sp. AC402]|uniref:DEAD/DEAH box helicase n=1 Tax=Asticcacaulis sp. AC402 TaxID=1282361 RepID=UPI0003C40D37|nr:DEAD/DEAH box helicase [Asticcacaulis sp. AC402]ESQ74519.1 hypothetical protein ABAC402_13605 [Asticcacaulis sp. AC402]
MKPFAILSEIRARAVEAVLSQSGLAHEGLKTHLRSVMSGPPGSAGVLLQEPIIEGAHPFVTAPFALGNMPKPVLDPRFVKVLDGLAPTDDYRFPATRRPFRHQYAAWEQLSAKGDPQSVLVTSGTGSGKTECFLFPILSDLVTQAEQTTQRLEGVQAIMLYPLNALIESQKERLSAWTAPYAGKIRYCLYNGDLPKSAPTSDHRRTPEQVVDRNQLRASPPPVLVTNVTMLEYMLSRADDQPIIEKSKGKLKWIVLDEAHSLVGAAAAEIALLLRRVLLAFETEPEQVHFVATSATIGSGPDILQTLQRFLAEVAGIADAKVHVIEGDRQMPGKPDRAPSKAEDLETADPGYLYDHLGSDPDVWGFIERLHKGTQSLEQAGRIGKRFGLNGEAFVNLLTRAERLAPDTGEPERLAPVRIHAFERAVPGVWSCLNPKCRGRPEKWPFGRLFTEKANTCPDCQAPVLEAINCTECGEAFLDAEEDLETGRLVSPVRIAVRDEFDLDADTEAPPEEADDGEKDNREIFAPAANPHILLAANPMARARSLNLNKQTWNVEDKAGDGCSTFLYDEFPIDERCPCCQVKAKTGIYHLMRPMRFGAPFLIGNAAPLLLEGVDPATTLSGQLPSDGRRLLSFTDSRQGTARLSAKIQAEAERNFVRSFVYHSVQASMMASQDDSVIGELQADIAKWEAAYQASPMPIIEGEIQKRKEALSKLTSGSTDGVAWDDMVDRLAARPEIENWIKDVWEPRDPELFNEPRKLARFMLLREFARRPRKANSLETLGLARLRIPSIDAITSAPAVFARQGKSVDDWKDFLYAMVTHFVRANSAIGVSRSEQHWLMPKVCLHSLLPPDQTANGDKRRQIWPSIRRVRGQMPGPLMWLLRGLVLRQDEAADKDDLDECMRMAWHSLQPVFGNDPEHRAFDFTKTWIAPVQQAYVCQITRRLLDRTPFGITPYGRFERVEEKLTVLPVTMPNHPAPQLGQVDVQPGAQKIKTWLQSEPEIVQLRLGGQWTAITDRIAEFAQYARSAEHSAQQDSQRLRRYEKAFKEGKINILNCSTTMEMGVDIGSVSIVMMTNVPPSIASYRQRVGRAGRRGQSSSLAFTFCKDNPLDREAFRKPADYLKRTVAAPKVALSSRPIVQRHVNAYLLRAFILEQSGNAIQMMIGTFLGCPADPAGVRPILAERPVALFKSWLDLPSVKAAHRAALANLVRRSVLEGETNLVDETRSAIDALEVAFVAEWEGIRALARDEGVKDAGKSRMHIELKRLCEDFLLGALAGQGFLPGHGFPTDVVTFLPAKAPKKDDQDLDGRSRFRSQGPQRSLDLAIRDYAPGSEIVLDGLVHRSEGVTLNWKRPATEEGLVEIQSLKYHWSCRACGTSDTSRGVPNACTACGSSDLEPVEYLRPSGFTVDVRQKAHADTDVVSYVPPEDPKASTRDAPWTALPIPDAGRFRSSREGLVFYANKGPHRCGFSVCLYCGRAEADEQIWTANDPKSRPFYRHKPLRHRKGEVVDVCPGTEQSWKIRSNLTLGHEITTDVFELQPVAGLNRASSTALVIALREGLARELGVEADEMGFSVKQTTGRFGKQAVSMLLFDKAAGGAGFSVSLESKLANVLLEASKVLDCKTPGCTTGCAACVMTSDAPVEENGLDRLGALNFLREHLSFPATLAKEDKFSADAVLSHSVVDEIGEALRDGVAARLSIFATPTFDAAGLTAWSAATDFSNWRHLGYEIDLVLPSTVVPGLDAAARLALHAFVLTHGIQLRSGDAPGSHPTMRVLAAVKGQVRTLAWASRDDAAGLPGASWAQPSLHLIARGSLTGLPDYPAIDPSSLLPLPTTKFASIESELDISIGLFGNRMATQIRSLLDACGLNTTVPITGMTYKDPYVSSPLVARLLIDTLAALAGEKGRGAEIKIFTQHLKSSSDYGPPTQASHNWREESAAKGVIEAYGRLKRLNVVLDHKETVPHGRYLNITYGDGSKAQVVFDQGFGAWSPAVGQPMSHGFRLDIPRQVDQISRQSAPVRKSRFGPTYLVAVKL